MEYLGFANTWCIIWQIVPQSPFKYIYNNIIKVSSSKLETDLGFGVKHQFEDIKMK